MNYLEHAALAIRGAELAHELNEHRTAVMLLDFACDCLGQVIEMRGNAVRREVVVTTDYRAAPCS